MRATRTVTYDADGIGHEGAGLDDVQRRRAEALAQEGYVALAMDFHGGRWFDDGDEMRARVRPLLASPDRLREIGTAALAALLAEPRADPDAVAAIGSCAGGSLVLELARPGADLEAVVAFHPSLRAGRLEDAARIRGSVCGRRSADRCLDTAGPLR